MGMVHLQLCVPPEAEEGKSYWRSTYVRHRALNSTFLLPKAGISLYVCCFFKFVFLRKLSLFKEINRLIMLMNFF